MGRKEANKKYYDTKIKPFRVIKSKHNAKFHIRGVCGLCGMSVRTNNLKKIQRMRFKTVTSLGSLGFVWLDYNPQGLPEEEFKAIRKGMFENVKRILVYLGLNDQEKEEISILLNLRIVFIEKTTPIFSSSYKNYSEKAGNYVQKLNPLYEEKLNLVER